MATLFSFILFLTVISTSFSVRLHKRDTQDDAYWNDIVNTMVRQVAEEMIEEYGEYTPVKDWNDTFGGSLLKGQLSASGGSIGNFSTLNFDNISVSTTPDSLTASVQVSLDQLDISYSRFKASMRFVSASGSFRANVGSNLLTTKVTLKLVDDSCAATLDTLKLTKFSDISMQIQSEDVGNQEFVNNVANFAAKKFTPELKSMAESMLQEMALPYVKLVCEYFE